MSISTGEAGAAELRAALRQSRGWIWSVAFFSIFVNLLLLTGPVYMLQVYDRVLTSRSEETLVALTGMVAFLFLLMGILDFVRSRILDRVGARFQNALEHRVFCAGLSVASGQGTYSLARNGLYALGALRQIFGSPVVAAVFDLPWSLFFLFGIWLFHPFLGMLALCGGGVLIALTLTNAILSQHRVLQAAKNDQAAMRLSDDFLAEADMVRSLGMLDALQRHLGQLRFNALRSSINHGDLAGGFTAMGKTLRLFLQSAMLGLGAFLVLRSEISAGVMIACSILLGRALAPVEQIISQWASIARAKKAWRNLSDLLGAVPLEVPQTKLPLPKAQLAVRDLTIIPHGQEEAALSRISFDLRAGEVLGVIGPSGAGKSTLARALTGAVAPAGGQIRLDGAKISQYSPEDCGRYLGYLPQRVALFEGSIGDNIAGFDTHATDHDIIRAAKDAAAHELIKRLPEDYKTPIKGSADRLSGGELQRIALARALYGDPVLLILDEPNANLDNEGQRALNASIRKMKAAGRAVIIMAHRPSAIEECDRLLVLSGGRCRAFGPRDAVLKEMVQNESNIRQFAGRSGIV